MPWYNWKLRAANDDIKCGWFSYLSYIVVPGASYYYVNVLKRILQLPIVFRYTNSWCDCHTCLLVKGEKERKDANISRLLLRKFWKVIWNLSLLMSINSLFKLTGKNLLLQLNFWNSYRQSILDSGIEERESWMNQIYKSLYTTSN